MQMDSHVFDLPERPGISADGLAEILMIRLREYGCNPQRFDPPFMHDNGKMNVRVFFLNEDDVVKAMSYVYMLDD
jgi:hypothetical protein